MKKTEWQKVWRNEIRNILIFQPNYRGCWRLRRHHTALNSKLAHFWISLININFCQLTFKLWKSITVGKFQNEKIFHEFFCHLRQNGPRRHTNNKLIMNPRGKYNYILTFLFHSVLIRTVFLLEKNILVELILNCGWSGYRNWSEKALKLIWYSHSKLRSSYIERFSIFRWKTKILCEFSVSLEISYLSSSMETITE